MKYALLILMIALLGCNNHAKYDKLYIQTLTVNTVNGSQTRDESISEVDLDYFEIDFCSMRGGSYYSGQKEIEWTIIDQNNSKLVRTFITDELGELLKFKTSEEFLNFMSDRGYEMIDQNKEKLVTHYTFKRK